MNSNHPKALDAEAWRTKLRKISENLPSATQLTLMGSGATMLSGQDFRASMDLDIWKPTSQFKPQELQHAVESCGLLYNPTEDEPATPYIQIVEPGICQLGSFQPRRLETKKNLALEIPPPENLIASKLKRANPKDLEDIAWILAHEEYIGNPTPCEETIQAIIRSFPKTAREPALENLVFLKLLLPPKPNPPPETPNPGAQPPPQPDKHSLKKQKEPLPTLPI